MSKMNAGGRVGDQYAARLRRSTGLHGRGRVRGQWRVVCKDKHGREKWVEQFENIIVDVGLDYLLDVALAVASQEPNWYIGLKDTGTPVGGDTLASHGSWSELAGGGTLYTGNRPAWTPGAVASQSVSNSASPASFAIVASDVVYGAFLCTVATGTAGLLYSAGDFSSSRAVENGDTLEVTATFSMADDGV